MYSIEDEYINATKNARVNRHDDEKVPMKSWLMNFALFSMLIMGGYYTYLYFTKSNKPLTRVMGVSYTKKLEVKNVAHINSKDNDLMEKLYGVEVDKIDVERDNKSISDAMKKIVDESTIKANYPYLKELSMEIDSNKVKNKEKSSKEIDSQ